MPMRTIGFGADGSVEVIDQTRLPLDLVVRMWSTVEDAAVGIETMEVRGAPLIGVAAAHGVALAMAEDPSLDGLGAAVDRLTATRPTAANLRWALQRMDDALRPLDSMDRPGAAMALAERLADEDVAACQAMGDAGLPLLTAIAEQRVGRPVRVMTHCNAGWLAAVDWGTALAPVYRAVEAGVAVEVWVSETRPRNQGASLTAWELGAHGVPHTLVVDNACGHLLATGQVDVVLVGADRVAANGDVANKVGTYLKALAADANGVPFHVVAPTSTVDHRCPDGAAIPIEERSPDEVTHLAGRPIAPLGTSAANPAFDVTPAALVTSLVTERGIVACTPEGIATLPR